MSDSDIIEQLRFDRDHWWEHVRAVDTICDDRGIPTQREDGSRILTEDRVRLAFLGESKLPGHTCLAIDKAQRAMRRLAWRARNPDRASDVIEVLAEGLALLEQVRSENAEMRKAYYDMRERLRDGKT
jgi:hypothetical protein